MLLHSDLLHAIHSQVFQKWPEKKLVDVLFEISEYLNKFQNHKLMVFVGLITDC